MYLSTTKYSSAIRQEVAKAGAMAQPVQGLACKQEDLSWIPGTHTRTPAVVAHTSDYRVGRQMGRSPRLAGQLV